MLKLKVAGMSCGHCAQRVTQALKALPSVDQVTVDLGAGEVTVEGEPETRSVQEAVTEAGYDVLEMIEK